MAALFFLLNTDLPHSVTQRTAIASKRPTSVGSGHLLPPPNPGSLCTAAGSSMCGSALRSRCPTMSHLQGARIKCLQSEGGDQSSPGRGLGIPSILTRSDSVVERRTHGSSSPSRGLTGTRSSRSQRYRLMRAPNPFAGAPGMPVHTNV